MCGTQGGDFTFTGCAINQCSGGDRTGYVLGTEGRDVDALGVVSCAEGYEGTAKVTCSSNAGIFEFSGCADETNVLLFVGAGAIVIVLVGLATALGLFTKRKDNEVAPATTFPALPEETADDTVVRSNDGIDGSDEDLSSNPVEITTEGTSKTPCQSYNGA